MAGSMTVKKEFRCSKSDNSFLYKRIKSFSIEVLSNSCLNIANITESAVLLFSAVLTTL